MEIIKKHRTAAALLAAAILLCLLFKRSFPLVLYTLGLIVAYFPLKNSLSNSLVFRGFVALAALLCVFQLEAIVFWALKIWVSPLVYVLTTLAITLIGVWSMNRSGRSSPGKFSLGWLDALLILPGLLIGGVYITGTLAPAEKDQATIVRSIMYGMDDATHANIFSDMLRHDSNILAGDERSKLMNKSVHASYPMGWHVSSSIAVQSVIGSRDRTPIQNVAVYFYTKVLTLVLTLTSITLLAYSLAKRFWPQLQPVVTTATVAGISLFVGSLLVLPLFFDGFFSFMPIILYTALFAVILIDNSDDVWALALLALLAAASSLTWMLTGPILMAALAFYYYDRAGSLGKIGRRVYAGLAISGIFLLAQAYILYSTNKSALVNISNPGGIVNPEHWLLAVGLVLFFVLWLRKDKARESIARPLFGVVGAFAASLALLLLYLTGHTSEITYYFYKLQVPLLVVLTTIVCTYLFGLLFSRHGRKLLDRFIILAVGSTALALFIPSIIGYSYVYDVVNRAHSYVISSSDAAILTDDVLDRQISNDNIRTYFMFPSENARNILISNIDKLGYRSEACDYDLFAAAYDYDVKAFDKALDRCTPELPQVKIYTSEEGKRQILESIDTQLIKNQEIELVVI